MQVWIILKIKSHIHSASRLRKHGDGEKIQRKNHLYHMSSDTVLKLSESAASTVAQFLIFNSIDEFKKFF